MSSSLRAAYFEHSLDGAVTYAADLASRDARLIDIYNSYFETIVAETGEHLMSAFRLRYEVYCVENPFEDPKNNPYGMETDCYDAGALHSLLMRRATKDVVGTVRLILPRCDGEGIGLPMHDVCDHELMVRDSRILPWASTAEISRFAVSKKLRRRATDQRLLGNFTPPDDGSRRRIPDTSLGLMQAIVAMAALGGITHLCAVMEPTLLRMLGRLGIHFTPLGPQVNYHGRRQPCYSYLDAQLARVWLERPDVWELLTREGTLWPLNVALAASLRSGGNPIDASPMRARIG